jgi:uncharacterized protein (DUF2249 family)
MMTRHVELDVRPVEPKDRFERIMGAYEGLTPDQVLELTVDHDPKCMYYALQATRGAGAFSFEYLEAGPEIWRVKVRKRRLPLAPGAAAP